MAQPSTAQGRGGAGQGMVEQGRAGQGSMAGTPEAGVVVAAAQV